MDRERAGCELHYPISIKRGSLGLLIAERTSEEQPSGLAVRSHALQQGQCIAHSVRRRGRQLRWIKQGIDRNDLLQKASHDSLSIVSILQCKPPDTDHKYQMSARV